MPARRWKRVLTAVAFVVLLGAALLGLNERYKHSDYYRSLSGLVRFESVPEQLQVVNLGSSHARYGIDYSGHPELRAFNFAMDSQRIEYDERILNAYADHIQEDAVVFFVVSYFTFFHEQDLPLGPEALNYYRVLPRADIPAYSLRQDLLYHIFPVLTAQREVMRVFEPTGNPDQALTDTDVPAERDVVKQKGEERAARHVGIYRTCPPGETDRAVSALQRMLALCEERHWQAVLVTTPYLWAYEQAIPEEMKQAHYALIREIQEDFPAVPYLDYSSDSRFAENSSLFCNTDHMNQAGRLLFTEILLEESAAGRAR